MDAAQLRAWRERYGYSQSKLAARLGLDVMSVSRWERGVHAIPAYLPLALSSIARAERWTRRYHALNADNDAATRAEVDTVQG